MPGRPLGTPGGPAPLAGRHAIALEAALRRLLEDYASQYLRPRPLPAHRDTEGLPARFRRLRERSGAARDGPAGTGDVPEGFASLLSFADGRQGDLAADQGYPYRPLLAGEGPVR